MPGHLGEGIEEQGQIGDLSLKNGKRHDGVINEALTNAAATARARGPVAPSR
jgi:hypothetical protein